MEDTSSKMKPVEKAEPAKKGEKKPQSSKRPAKPLYKPKPQSEGRKKSHKEEESLTRRPKNVDLDPPTADKDPNWVELPPGHPDRKANYLKGTIVDKNKVDQKKISQQLTEGMLEAKAAIAAIESGLEESREKLKEQGFSFGEPGASDNLNESVAPQVPKYVAPGARKPAKVDPRPAIHLGFALTESQIAKAKDLYPSLRFEWDQFATVHDHPYTAMERRVAEFLIFRRLEKGKPNVIDIHGNPFNHKHTKRDNVHVCAPKHESKQDLDWAKYTRTDGLKVCDCEPLHCAHVVPDIYVKQYLAERDDAEHLCRLVNKSQFGQMYIVARHFNDIAGSLTQGEISYTRNELCVDFFVKGSLSGYKVADESWLFTSTHWTNGSIAMSWDVTNRVGDCHIIQLVKSDPSRGSGPVKPIGILKALMDAKSVGPVELDIRGAFAKDPAVATAYESLKVEYAQCYSLYNWIIFVRKEDKRVLVPKKAVDEVRVYVAGLPRTPQLFQLTLTNVKKILKHYNLTPDMIADSIMPVAILGYFRGVEVETGLMAVAVESHHEPIKRLTTLLEFKPPKVWSMNFFALSTLSLVAFVGILLYRRRRNNQKVPPFSVVDSILSLFSVFELISNKITSYLIDGMPSWVNRLMVHAAKQGTHKIKRVQVATGPSDGSRIEYHEPLHYPDVCNDGRKLTQLHEDSWVKLPDNMYCVEHHGLTLFGAGIRPRIPVISRSCVHNEAIAVTNRGCLERPDPSPVIFAMMTKTYDAALPVLPSGPYMEGKRLKAPKFWVWVKRFPEKRRNELTKAYLELKATSHSVNPGVDGFVKREHVLKAHPEAQDSEQNFDLYDPRLIQGRHPDYQVKTGPITFAFTKYLAWCWNAEVTHGKIRADDETRPTTCIVYTSGMTAETLGSAVEFHLERLSKYGRVFIYESDQSRFDAHCGKEAIQLKNRPYKRFRCTKASISEILQHSTKTRGYTKHGVKYYVTYTVKSGEGDTSSGDTAISGSGNLLAKDLARVPDHLIVIFSVGDDILVLTIEQYARDYFSAANLVWLEAGFRVEHCLLSSMYDAEYCSGRFYPTADGLCFGPKIGRILSKTFYSKNDYSDSTGQRWLLAVAQGLERDCSFIPVLRRLMTKVIELTAHRKPLELPYEEKIHAEKHHEASPDTYAMLEHLYDLKINHFDELERLIDTISSLPCTIHHPYIDHIVNVDCPAVDQPRKSQVPLFSLLNVNPKVLKSAIILLLWWDNHCLRSLFQQPNLYSALDIYNVLVAPVLEEGLRMMFPWINKYLIGVEIINILFIRQALLAGGQLDATAANLFAVCGVLSRFLHIPMAWLARSSPMNFALVVSIHAWLNDLFTRSSFPHRPVSFTPSRVSKTLDDLKLLAPGCEAIIDCAWSLTTTAWNKLMHILNGNTVNYKSALCELCSKFGWPQPAFTFVGSGPSHMPTFTCTVTLKILGQEYVAQGVGNNKSEAQLLAARDMLTQVKAIDPVKEPVHESQHAAKLFALRKELSIAYPFKNVLIDADQCAPPRSRPLLRATTTYIVGNSDHMEPWKKFCATREHDLGTICARIVPTQPDAADKLLLNVLKTIPPEDAILVTGDKLFREAVKAISTKVLMVEHLDDCPINFPRLSTQIPKNVLAALMHFVLENVETPPPPIRLQTTDVFERW
jgi:hypothetical protein